MLSKGGNEHMRTLNNTEWGGGGRGCVPELFYHDLCRSHTFA